MTGATPSAFEFNPAVAGEVQRLYAGALDAIDRIAATAPDFADTLTSHARKYAERGGFPFQGAMRPTIAAMTLRNQGGFLWDANKLCNPPALRARIADALAALTLSLSGLASPPASANPLGDDGLVPLPGLLTPEMTSDMRRYFESRAERRREESVLHHTAADVVRAPHAFQIVADERILAIAGAQIGAPATVVQMDAWWSQPEGPKPAGLQVFHRDRDDFRACKLFVYLNDVPADAGPHIFVRKSHRADVVAARGGQIDQLFAGDVREQAGAIETLFGDDITEITGPAGTSFIENTYGLHRGKVPENAPRLVFQATYAAVPYPQRLKRWLEAGLPAPPPEAARSPAAAWALRLTACRPG